MGAYKNTLVVKKIYLPIEEGEELTLDEYKEKYGIDLRKFIKLNDDKDILTLFGDVELYLVCKGWEEVFGTSVRQVSTNIVKNAYSSGLQNGVTILGVNPDNEYGIEFYISRDEEFSVDNVIIMEYEA